MDMATQLEDPGATMATYKGSSCQKPISSTLILPRCPSLTDLFLRPAKVQFGPSSVRQLEVQFKSCSRLVPSRSQSNFTSAMGACEGIPSFPPPWLREAAQCPAQWSATSWTVPEDADIRAALADPTHGADIQTLLEERARIAFLSGCLIILQLVWGVLRWARGKSAARRQPESQALVPFPPACMTQEGRAGAFTATLRPQASGSVAPPVLSSAPPMGGPPMTPTALTTPTWTRGKRLQDRYVTQFSSSRPTDTGQPPSRSDAEQPPSSFMQPAHAPPMLPMLATTPNAWATNAWAQPEPRAEPDQQQPHAPVQPQGDVHGPDQSQHMAWQPTLPIKQPMWSDPGQQDVSSPRDSTTRDPERRRPHSWPQGTSAPYSSSPKHHSPSKPQHSPLAPTTSQSPLAPTTQLSLAGLIPTGNEAHTPPASGVGVGLHEECSSSTWNPLFNSEGGSEEDESELLGYRVSTVSTNRGSRLSANRQAAQEDSAPLPVSTRATQEDSALLAGTWATQEDYAVPAGRQSVQQDGAPADGRQATQEDSALPASRQATQEDSPVLAAWPAMPAIIQVAQEESAVLASVFAAPPATQAAQQSGSAAGWHAPAAAATAMAAPQISTPAAPAAAAPVAMQQGSHTRTLERPAAAAAMTAPGDSLSAQGKSPIRTLEPLTAVAAMAAQQDNMPAAPAATLSTAAQQGSPVCTPAQPVAAVATVAQQRSMPAASAPPVAMAAQLGSPARTPARRAAQAATAAQQDSAPRTPAAAAAAQHSSPAHMPAYLAADVAMVAVQQGGMPGTPAAAVVMAAQQASPVQLPAPSPPAAAVAVQQGSTVHVPEPSAPATPTAGQAGSTPERTAAPRAAVATVALAAQLESPMQAPALPAADTAKAPQEGRMPEPPIAAATVAPQQDSSVLTPGPTAPAAASAAQQVITEWVPEFPAPAAPAAQQDIPEWVPEFPAPAEAAAQQGSPVRVPAPPAPAEAAAPQQGSPVPMSAASAHTAAEPVDLDDSPVRMAPLPAPHTAQEDSPPGRPALPAPRVPSPPTGAKLALSIAQACSPMLEFDSLGRPVSLTSTKSSSRWATAAETALAQTPTAAAAGTPRKLEFDTLGRPVILQRRLSMSSTPNTEVPDTPGSLGAASPSPSLPNDVAATVAAAEAAAGVAAAACSFPSPVVGSHSPETPRMASGGARVSVVSSAVPAWRDQVRVRLSTPQPGMTVSDAVKQVAAEAIAMMKVQLSPGRPRAPRSSEYLSRTTTTTVGGAAAAATTTTSNSALTTPRLVHSPAASRCSTASPPASGTAQRSPTAPGSLQHVDAAAAAAASRLTPRKLSRLPVAAAGGSSSPGGWSLPAGRGEAHHVGSSPGGQPQSEWSARTDTSPSQRSMTQSSIAHAAQLAGTAAASQAVTSSQASGRRTSCWEQRERKGLSSRYVDFVALSSHTKPGAPPGAQQQQPQQGAPGLSSAAVSPRSAEDMIPRPSPLPLGVSLFVPTPAPQQQQQQQGEATPWEGEEGGKTPASGLVRQQQVFMDDSSSGTPDILPFFLPESPAQAAEAEAMAGEDATAGRTPAHDSGTPVQGAVGCQPRSVLADVV